MMGVAIQRVLVVERSVRVRVLGRRIGCCRGGENVAIAGDLRLRRRRRGRDTTVVVVSEAGATPPPFPASTAAPDIPHACCRCFLSFLSLSCPLERERKRNLRGGRPRGGK